jgi:hypothetical protein
MVRYGQSVPSHAYLRFLLATATEDERVVFIAPLELARYLHFSDLRILSFVGRAYTGIDEFKSWN